MNWNAVVAMLSMSAAQASAPWNPVPLVPSYGDALIRMVVSLGSVIGVLLLAAWLLRWKRRTGPVGTPGLLKVVSSCSLGTGQTVHLLRVGEQFVLVGTGAQGVKPITDITLDDESLSVKVGACSAPSAARVVPFHERLEAPERAEPERSTRSEGGPLP